MCSVSMRGTLSGLTHMQKENLLHLRPYMVVYISGAFCCYPHLKHLHHATPVNTKTVLN